MMMLRQSCRTQRQKSDLSIKDNSISSKNVIYGLSNSERNDGDIFMRASVDNTNSTQCFEVEQEEYTQQKQPTPNTNALLNLTRPSSPIILRRRKVKSKSTKPVQQPLQTSINQQDVIKNDRKLKRKLQDSKNDNDDFIVSKRKRTKTPFVKDLMVKIPYKLVENFMNEYEQKLKKRYKTSKKQGSLETFMVKELHKYVSSSKKPSKTTTRTTDDDDDDFVEPNRFRTIQKHLDKQKMKLKKKSKTNSHCDSFIDSTKDKNQSTSLEKQARR
ncbi:unnamed protein product [Didymodactylos carnosus]|uniref:Uncharacterized protein n=2 Tax=Didymodactylos carnosus TaxID=1234261 RepID=A0A814KZD5_9BILA|nr:unnamed protein product [Didymodactylos carnosus]CAF3827470.1 unnamed protein product [Didymodactylos carnosus]